MPKRASCNIRGVKSFHCNPVLDRRISASYGSRKCGGSSRSKDEKCEHWKCIQIGLGYWPERSNFCHKFHKQNLFVLGGSARKIKVCTFFLEFKEFNACTHLQMSSQSLLHVKLFITIWEIADEFRIWMIIQMRPQIVHASEKLAAEFTRLEKNHKRSQKSLLHRFWKLTLSLASCDSACFLRFSAVKKAGKGKSLVDGLRTFKVFLTFIADDALMIAFFDCVLCLHMSI